jgi:hypothetical protein
MQNTNNVLTHSLRSQEPRTMLGDTTMQASGRASTSVAPTLRAMTQCCVSSIPLVAKDHQEPQHVPGNLEERLLQWTKNRQGSGL